MRRWWIVSAGTLALGLAHAAAAMGQDQPYETPKYTAPLSSLEKNYGLPTFGTRGAELPSQRTMAPAKAAPPEPDFFKSPPDFTFPKRTRSTTADQDMDTPRYTTSDGSTLDDAPKPDTGELETDSSSDR